MATDQMTSIDAAALRQGRIEMAVMLRAAASHGFNESVDNHFSLALPGRDDLFLLNRWGPHWSEIRPADILLIDLHGTVVDGEGAWEMSAFMIHRGVHRAHPRARCVLHTHMPHATALSMSVEGLDTRASQNAMYFHDRIGRVPFGGLADGAEEGDRLGEAVGDDATVVFLDNHGVIAIGQTPAEAFHRLYMLERACETEILLRASGLTRIRVAEETAAATAAQWERDAPDLAATLFAAERRLSEERSPGFLD